MVKPSCLPVQNHPESQRTRVANGQTAVSIKQWQLGSFSRPPPSTCIEAKRLTIHLSDKEGKRCLSLNTVQSPDCTLIIKAQIGCVPNGYFLKQLTTLGGNIYSTV